jgi:photosystem II stability/assembly factor-like uncharacterized protein
VGAVAVCEADPDIVYIGTGETELRGNVQQGDGVYKSTDAPETWDRVSEANEAVILISDIKTQIDDRIEASEDVELRSFGTYMKNRLGRIEEEVYQVRNRSSQDLLNFPIKLNNKLG